MMISLGIAPASSECVGTAVAGAQTDAPVPESGFVDVLVAALAYAFAEPAHEVPTEGFIEQMSAPVMGSEKKGEPAADKKLNSAPREDPAQHTWASVVPIPMNQVGPVETLQPQAQQPLVEHLTLNLNLSTDASLHVLRQTQDVTPRVHYDLGEGLSEVSEAYNAPSTQTFQSPVKLISDDETAMSLELPRRLGQKADLVVGDTEVVVGTKASPVIASQPLAGKLPDTIDEQSAPTVAHDAPELRLQPLRAMNEPIRKLGAAQIQDAPEVTSARSAGRATLVVDAPVLDNSDKQSDAAEPARAPEAPSGVPEAGANVGARSQPSISEAGVVTESSEPPLELPRQVLDQVIREVKLHRLDEIHGLTVKLQPPELGTLHIRLISDSQGVTSQIEASSPQVRSLLQAHVPMLADALSNAGVRLDSITITSTMDLTAYGHGAPREHAQGNDAYRHSRREAHSVRSVNFSGEQGSYYRLESATYSWLA